MSMTHQVTHPLSTTQIRVRSRLVAIVVATAVALTLGLLALTGFFDGNPSRGVSSGGHLPPAIQYPGTGQPPSSRADSITIKGADSEQRAARVVPAGRFGPVQP